MLLYSRADPSAADHQGETPLHTAAMGGYTDVIEALCAYSGSIEAVDDNGWTALRVAAERCSMPSIRALMHAKAAIDDSIGVALKRMKDLNGAQPQVQSAPYQLSFESTNGFELLSPSPPDNETVGDD
mmetsp:Transcript_26693/g.69011  ORF Transcript_26693/g.69011 Transcript_26693/m.69011 type:complete len:128 (+) Transcript_26693:96-479(+)